MRSRSSAAALRLNVRARIRSGAMPRFSIRSATVATIVVVLPVPGPASTSSGPPAWSTTCCCAWSRRGAPLFTGPAGVLVDALAAGAPVAGVLVDALAAGLAPRPVASAGAGLVAGPAPAAARGRRTRRYAGAFGWSITAIPADATDISRAIRAGPSVSRRAGFPWPRGAWRVQLRGWVWSQGQACFRGGRMAPGRVLVTVLVMR